MDGAGHANAPQQQGHETDEGQEAPDIPKRSARLLLLPLDGGEFEACSFDAVFDALRQVGHIRFPVEFDVAGMIDPTAELFETRPGQVLHRHEDHRCDGTGEPRLSGR